MKAGTAEFLSFAFVFLGSLFFCCLLMILMFAHISIDLGYFKASTGIPVIIIPLVLTGISFRLCYFFHKKAHQKHLEKFH